MNVLYVASEAFPLIKTGGLGDVAGALPLALEGLGADVRLMLPAYRGLADRLEGPEKPVHPTMTLAHGEARLVEGLLPGSDLKVWLVDAPELFDRPGGPYLGPDGRDWPDNARRFAVLAEVAAMAAGGVAGWRPDVIHANDWQTGLIPAFLRFAEPAAAAAPVLFTVHNMQFAGRFSPDVLPDLGLPPQAFSTHAIEFYGDVSFLKAGLFCSQALSTVSPTYAREIQEAALGYGFEGLLAARSGDLVGILNGADYRTWNPASDRRIAHSFERGEMDGKRACRDAVLAELGLDRGRQGPLFCVVSRLTGQKGMDLVLAALPQLLADGGLLALLGTGEPGLEAAMTEAAGGTPGAISATIGFDEDLAHRIIAGADVLLMPSRFEPCGLTQLYAMKYGTRPLVRRTGGLADSVADDAEGEGTGFVFDGDRPEDMVSAVERVRAAYGDSARWQALMDRAMTADFGWERAARSYQAVYQGMLSKSD